MGWIDCTHSWCLVTTHRAFRTCLFNLTESNMPLISCSYSHTCMGSIANNEYHFIRCMRVST